jgi:DNA-binding NtrC family response regulator
MATAKTNSGTKPKILVIDDEEVVRILFENLLNEEGFGVLLAQDGREGIEILDTHHPPLVLVDKNLPDISGVDLISTQKRRHPNTEFIMITGYASLDSAVKAMEAGAFSYLTKPFGDMNVVLERIKAALEVNNLRIETEMLKTRLSDLSVRTATPDAAPRPTSPIPQKISEQLRRTLSFLESFSNKRDQPPTPPIWARLVDMVEEECRRLRKMLAD